MIVLIHGPFHERWLRIAKASPKHRFIISTWATPNTKSVPENVVLIENVDPGELPIADNNKNLHRFITSIKNVLNLIPDHEVVFRVRSDAIIKYSIDNYEEIWHQQDHFWTECQRYKVFDRKMIIGEHYTVHPDSTLNLHFHPGDWFSISTGSDLKKFWQHIPLRTDVDQPSVLRTEQYLWLHCLRHFYPDLPFLNKDVEENNTAKEASTLALLNNFIVYGNNDIGVWVEKYPQSLIPHPEMFRKEYLKGN